ncbi:hypothetical protein PPQ61_000212 [Salmonella enterica]|nr:hypothetical protein [Salmonella enterica]EDQ8164754.1 hypothetical protein [Salmonella enterica subsp. diarizonae]EDR7605324.1 hypothetical protein [Salmonella enterica subsp. diarizonae]EDS4571794.1 hypothetical protein [Salmonella enterica]EDU7908623.1 hypothetical protein [Salmonella enterica subsp. diarizonae]EDV3804396.1 hypothetical protein [Salmonella enterica subsp. diarizonae]
MNLPRLYGTLSQPMARGHSKSMATGLAHHTLTSHSPSLCPFRIGKYG